MQNQNVLDLRRSIVATSYQPKSAARTRVLYVAAAILALALAYALNYWFASLCYAGSTAITAHGLTCAL